MKPERGARITDAVPFGDGWVATGNNRVLVSGDGHSWRESPAPAKLRSVAVAGDRIVAISTDRKRRELWTSSDGVVWTRSEVPQLDGRTPRLQALTASPSRFVLVGAVTGATVEACWGEVTHDAYGVWTSRDGDTWTRLEVDLPERFWLEDIAATDQQVILVGRAGFDDETRRPVVVRTPALLMDAGSAPGIRPGYWVPPPAPVWSPLDVVDMPDEAGMTRLLDGRVLFAGGPRRQAQLAVIVDPVAGKREKVGPLPEPASEPVLTTAPDGRVYLLPDDARIQRFDPKTGRWRLMRSRTRRAAGPTDPPPTVSSAAWMPDGRLLVASWPPMDRPGAPRFELYDPASDRLVPITTPPGERWGHTVVTTPGGETLAFTRSRAWRYDAVEGWIAGAPNPHLGGPFFGATPVPLSDGRVAVLVPEVGRVDIDAEDVDLCAENGDGFTLLDICDPAADAWSIVGAFPRMWGQMLKAVQLDDGRLLINSPSRGLVLADIPGADGQEPGPGA